MTLDEFLKQNAAWLEQTLKRPVFDKVDDKAIRFPEEQRQRRMQEIKARIDDLSQRKEAATASYDRALALERAELARLEAQKPAAAPTGTVKPGQERAQNAKKKPS